MNSLTARTAQEVDRLGRMSGGPFGEDDLEPCTWAVAEMGRAVDAVTYLESRDGLHAYTRRLAEFWAGGYDLLITPTLPEPPPLLGQFDATPDNPL